MILDTAKLLPSILAPIKAVWSWFREWLKTPSLEKLQQLGVIVAIAIIYRLLLA